MPVSSLAIKITPENVSQYKAVHNELVENLAWLAEQTQEYPVEVTIRGLRFVFDSEAEIEAVINLIWARLVELKAA